VLELSASSGRIDAWNSGDAYRWSSGGFTNNLGPATFSEGFKKGDVNHTMIENGGTGKGTISVGAYISKDKWINFDSRLTDNSGEYQAGQIAGFSSEGPTVDGRIKPDISAPGQGIISAINNQVYNPVPRRNRETLMDSTHFNGQAQWWQMLSGTSMASPHVCGIVALMLEANPQLTAEQIASILKETAIKDDNTGNVPNNKWGAGKVDALAAIKKAESLSLIHQVVLDATVYPNPANNLLQIKTKRPFNAYTIYSSNGSLIKTVYFKTPEINTTVNINNLSTGIYFVKIDGLGTSETIQIMVNND
jgi:subtilisin family serine protease